MSCLYVLEIKPSLVPSFASILSQSVGCLFVLFMVSFAVQKLLSVLFFFLMPSNHLILCCPLLFLPSIFPSNRIFSSESVLRIRWTKYWSFSFSISPSKEYSGLIAFRMTGLINLQSKGCLRVFSNITVQKRQFFIAQLSLWYNSHIHT